MANTIIRINFYTGGLEFEKDTGMETNYDDVDDDDVD